MPYSYEKNTYDVFNRLVSTTDEAGNKSTYTYYPSNLRLSKQVANGSNTTYTGFMWDGSQIVTEFDNDFNITNHYLFGRGQRRISGTNKTTNKQTYYIYNVHGDVEALADAGGVVTKTYRYDAFGNEENETAGDTNPFRYSGEYYDTETGNIYLRNRYYNPSTGTFITEDPVRDGGNWYSYCSGDPVNYIDPSGLKLYDYVEGNSKKELEKNKELNRNSRVETAIALMKLTNRPILFSQDGKISMGVDVLDADNEARTAASRDLISNIIISDEICVIEIEGIANDNNIEYDHKFINGVVVSSYISISRDNLPVLYVRSNTGSIVTETNYLATIVHELSHADQKIRWFNPSSELYEYTVDGYSKNPLRAPKNELQTVGIIAPDNKEEKIITENMFRSQYGYGERVIYGNDNFK